MRERTILLLDQDGVLLDNALYDAEWERLAEQAFATQVGGDPRAWPEAQRAAWARIEREAAEQHRALPKEARPTAAEWWDLANAAWIEEACGFLSSVSSHSAS